MRKEFILVIILAIIIVVLLAVLIFVSPINTETPPVVGGNSSIVIISLNGEATAGEISLPLKILGYVTGKDGWSGFEGQVGTVDLISEGGQKVGGGILKATSDWTFLPVYFEADVQTSVKCGGDSKCIFSGNAIFVFHNENPSGDSAKDKTFVLPVRIK